MRNGLVVLWMLLCSATSATAQVSFRIGVPGVSIGVNVPVYPQLVQSPATPSITRRRLNSNYFFYDGVYWIFQGDNWYASSWYNGRWGLVAPDVVPLYLLRVPVRYYRQPPAYFRGWRRMRRRAGVTTGATHGYRAAADGTAGIAVPCRPRPRCRSTSGNIRALDTRMWSSSRCCKPRITATSRTTPSCSSTIRRSGSKWPRRPFSRDGR